MGRVELDDAEARESNNPGSDYGSWVIVMLDAGIDRVQAGVVYRGRI